MTKLLLRPHQMSDWSETKEIWPGIVDKWARMPQCTTRGIYMHSLPTNVLKSDQRHMTRNTCVCWKISNWGHTEEYDQKMLARTHTCCLFQDERIHIALLHACIYWQICEKTGRQKQPWVLGEESQKCDPVVLNHAIDIWSNPCSHPNDATDYTVWITSKTTWTWMCGRELGGKGSASLKSLGPG
jgi:hypothetical protein